MNETLYNDRISLRHDQGMHSYFKSGNVRITASLILLAMLIGVSFIGYLPQLGGRFASAVPRVYALTPEPAYCSTLASLVTPSPPLGMALLMCALLIQVVRSATLTSGNLEVTSGTTLDLVNGALQINPTLFLTIDNGGTLNVEGGNGITNYQGTIPDSGTVNIETSGDNGISNYGVISITNSGTLNIETTGLYGIINFNPGAPYPLPTIMNSGVLTIENPKYTTGILNYGAITNELGGTINVENSGGTGIFNTFGAPGVPGVITNYATINVENTGGTGIDNYATINNECGGTVNPGSTSITEETGSTFNQATGCSVFPTPEFPLGSNLAILVPLAVFTAYILLRKSLLKIRTS